MIIESVIPQYLQLQSSNDDQWERAWVGCHDSTLIEFDKIKIMTIKTKLGQNSIDSQNSKHV